MNNPPIEDTEVNEGEVIHGQRLSREEEFYLAWGAEALRLNLTLVRDLLQRLITLAATLAGGSAAFLDEKIIVAPARLAAVLFFLGSMILALVAIYPRSDTVPMDPFAIRGSKANALDKKRTWLFWAYVLMGLGFCAVLVGMYVRL